MKLIAFLLITVIMQVSASTFAQKITLNKNQASLRQIMYAIRVQSGYDFLYNNKILKNAHPVTINVKDASIEEVLALCFTNQPISYKIEDRAVLLKLKGNLIYNNTINQTIEIPINGKVVDEKGQPIPGVTITEKGTKNITSTSGTGEFAIKVKDNAAILVISYIGYQTKELTAGDVSTATITLTPSEQKLDEVVVTALGVEKSSRGLSYNVQQLDGKQLTAVKQPNMINALNGKVAGVTISPSASGVGGSVKVNLRGNRSISGGNQPLYVIDGVPLQNGGNASGQANSLYGFGASEGGDGISNINPEDIASISVLEGASASALYGSQAQNGVILITTKKGKAGKAEININSGFQISNAAYRPKFQDNYGPSNLANKTDLPSWGDPINSSYNNLDQYFQTGNNFTNAINFSAGNSVAQTYISYANTAARGIQPTNDLDRHNLNLRETANFLDNKLTIDGSLNYISQNVNNTPTVGGFPNPLMSLYLFPRGTDITPYKENYIFTDKIGTDRENWPYKLGALHQENPWWLLNKHPIVNKRNRMFITASAKYTFADWLNIQVRGNMDRSTDDFERKVYWGTDPQYLGSGAGTSLYTINSLTRTQKYADAIANFKIPLQTKDFKIGGLIGGSITDTKNNGFSMGGALLTPDYFVATNIIALAPQQIGASTQATTTAPVLNPSSTFSPNHGQLQAVFGSLDLSYKTWAYATLTFRQDWSSALAFTDKQYYNYPSAGLSLIVSEMTKLPEFISYAKVRGSYTIVGSSIPTGLTRVQNTQNAAGSLIFNFAGSNKKLEPERTKTFEFGTDLRFMKDRINLNFTYYKTNTKNQFFPSTPTTTTLFGTVYYNAGNVQNTGFSAILGIDAIRNGNFSWNSAINASSNKNKILQVATLADGSDDTSPYYLTGTSYGYQSVVRKNGSYGDIYAEDFLRDDQGRIKLSANGTPQKTPFQYVGNPNPKFQAGWNNTFTYKDFSLSLLVDGKFGGQVMSLTQAYMDFKGVSAESGAARDAGGVSINAVDVNGNPVSTIDAKKYFETIGAPNSFAGAYMYSATVVRLREAALGYKFSLKGGFLRTASLSLTGRNLFYFYRKAPYDPELTMSTGNGISGVDFFSLPATREIGLNLSLNF
ncbi:SusC/RagA family TonB-linked outer membrane protein [Pedobacter psychrodurus]|uniref:SusC/RagA family TonB-linked outer membrane protein n=1 Tax=Pedobacter psychrodurus TaxID=2530456 RepID=UPI00292D027C|nr:SusC/RagA family TonB-linked outer membrane protein [Pedobacter psychrodurus]